MEDYNHNNSNAYNIYDHNNSYNIYDPNNSYNTHNINYFYYIHNPNNPYNTIDAVQDAYNRRIYNAIIRVEATR